MINSGHQRNGAQVITASTENRQPESGNLTDIADLGRHLGESVTLRGWVYHLRSSGKVRFLVLRDGTGLAQGVLVKGNLPEEDFRGFEDLTLESSLVLSGRVKAEPRAPGGFELEVTALSPVQI